MNERSAHSAGPKPNRESHQLLKGGCAAKMVRLIAGQTRSSRGSGVRHRAHPRPSGCRTVLAPRADPGWPVRRARSIDNVTAAAERSAAHAVLQDSSYWFTTIAARAQSTVAP